MVLAVLSHGCDRIIYVAFTDKRKNVGGGVAYEILLGQNVNCIFTYNLVASKSLFSACYRLACDIARILADYNITSCLLLF